MTETYEEIGAKFIESLGDEDVEHYGVKGMRWGVRRTDATLAKAAKKRSEEGGDKKSNAAPKGTVVGKTSTKKRSTDEMSDATLKKTINRMNMEKQYKQMTKPPPGKLEKVVSGVAKLTSEVALSVAKTQMTKIGNDKAALVVGNIMSGGPGQTSSAPALPRLTTPPKAKDRVTG